MVGFGIGLITGYAIGGISMALACRAALRRIRRRQGL